MQRLDLLFSNWIFIWFILYITGIISYNPTFIIIIAIILVLNATYIMWKYGATAYNLQKFVVINIFVKVIPLLLLWSQNKLTVDGDDIYFTFFLCIIYIIYSYLVYGTNFVVVYTNLVKSYINDSKGGTYLSKIYDHIYAKMSSTS